MRPHPASAEDALSARLRDTQLAFESVASDYDGPRGNNAVIQDMRAEMWRWLDATFAQGSRLLDIGCGTGLDAVRMAQRGCPVTAIDWSPGMIERTRDRATAAGLAHLVEALHIGAHQLCALRADEAFDGAYSNLGPLNCLSDLTGVSQECARLLKPGGVLVFTIIGRFCPWEILHYGRRRRWSRIAVRFTREAVPVGMNGHTIWTRYYTPRELYAVFAPRFTLEHHRGICTFVPPPYVSWVRDRHPGAYARLWSVDRRTAGWPLLRGIGDHFLIVMRKR